MDGRDRGTPVGVIGLGLIGGALARRLVQTGEAPVVFDLRADAVDAAVGAGAIAAPSARAVAERCEIVLLCVQTDEQCMAAVCGDDGALAGARPGGCIAVISTVLPAAVPPVALPPEPELLVLLLLLPRHAEVVSATATVRTAIVVMGRPRICAPVYPLLRSRRADSPSTPGVIRFTDRYSPPHSGSRSRAGNPTVTNR